MNMTLKDRINTFEKLGLFLEQFSKPGKNNSPVMQWLEELNEKFFRQLESLIQNEHISNPWFTEDNLRMALGSTARSLKTENIVSWLSCYRIPDRPQEEKTVAVVMAGNIPLAGFHDMLCVLISGHNLLARLSVKDENLPQIFAEIICFLDSRFESKITFKKSRLNDFNAVIATGSNNTSRYFEYYFGKYPNIIRKNRNSAAILDGSETDGELKSLSDDVFRYFGLGCRSVSKLIVPHDYDFKRLTEAFSYYRFLADHNNWANNYEYQRAIHLIDQIPHIDTGFFLLRENSSPASPISVINYERVTGSDDALDVINRDAQLLQCVVGKPGLSAKLTPFGNAQEPDLRDYADNVDTIEFLLNI